MGRWHLRRLLLLLGFTVVDAKDPELPLCPTNMQYFPQNLPMHCRMPASLPPFPSPMYQNPALGKQLMQMPVPLPGMPGSIPGPMPGPMPGQMPMPMVPMPAAPAHKLPVIVMPFYSPDTSDKKSHITHQARPPRKHRLHRRKKRPKIYSSDEDSTDTGSSKDTDDSTSNSADRGLWRGPRAGRRSNRHHKSKNNKHEQRSEILTPILQYVTKDGYVIFEKQISKGEAKDWLVSKSNNKNNEAIPKNINDFEYEPIPPKDDSLKDDTKFLVKDVEDIKVNTEMNPHLVHKKKNFKRKPIKQKGVH